MKSTVDVQIRKAHFEREEIEELKSKDAEDEDDLM